MRKKRAIGVVLFHGPEASNLYYKHQLINNLIGKRCPKDAYDRARLHETRSEFKPG